jgi:Phage integrase, N-terminal SAM-like domain
MYRYNKKVKVAIPALTSKRLLDQVRERIRFYHYSIKTEKAYVYWVKFYVLWSSREGAIKHPKEMGIKEVEAFLTMLANGTVSVPHVLKISAGTTTSPLDHLQIHI